MLVTLATGRGLMLVGDRVPQNLSCLNYWQPLLAAMRVNHPGRRIYHRRSNQVRLEYALLINHGPSTEALVPAPLYRECATAKSSVLKR